VRGAAPLTSGTGGGGCMASRKCGGTTSYHAGEQAGNERKEGSVTVGARARPRKVAAMMTAGDCYCGMARGTPTAVGSYHALPGVFRGMLQQVRHLGVRALLRPCLRHRVTPYFARWAQRQHRQAAGAGGRKGKDTKKGLKKCRRGVHATVLRGCEDNEQVIRLVRISVVRDNAGVLGERD
jgi:hypothetical protein